jgi:hypothetical protein
MAALVGVLLLGGFAQGRGVILPNGQELEEVDFERHVAGLLGRLGCNSGSCHGSFQGKGGFNLSLFGCSPEKDHQAITRSAMGRRINLADPELSLLLDKATARVPHGGGKRIDRNSWQFQVFRTWIVQRARHNTGSGKVRSIEVLPNDHVCSGSGDSVQLHVLAEFADGRREDVTPFCEIRPQDDSIAEATPAGMAVAHRPGDTALIVSYRGNIASCRILVPASVAEGFVCPNPAEHNFIDRLVFAKLRKLRIVPSETCTDADFLRRASLDVAGRLPTPDEVRSFLADERSDKRERRIDELLADSGHAALWATRWCDITGNSVETMEDPQELRVKRAKMWHDWLRLRFARNTPYDRIVHDILCATSRDGRETSAWMKEEIALNQAARKGFEADYAHRASLDLYWRRQKGEEFFPLSQMAERTAAAFLGVRIECAQCHKHPFDRWTQVDYRAFANVFAQVKFGSSPALRAEMSRLLAEQRTKGPDAEVEPFPHLLEVYSSNDNLRRFTHPESGELLMPKALGGQEITLDRDARESLFDWMIDPKNPFFARSFVNRVWAHYFGRGLVEPVDNLSAARPPSNGELLDALAEQFMAHRFDIRWLERTILQSRTYQLSSATNDSNVSDRRNYSHSSPRRLMAEVVLDMLDDALLTSSDFGPDVPRGTRAIEIGPNRLRSPTWTRVFRVFGRPSRSAACDCERPAEPALLQTMFLMSDPLVLEKIENGRLASLLEKTPDDRKVLDELFLAILSRWPTEDDRQAAQEALQVKKDRKAAFTDIVWALINTREFVLNH